MLQRVDTTAIPADIDTALSRPDWRHKIGWPVGLAETNAICAQQVRDALVWTHSLDDMLLRDAATLALPVVLAYSRAIVLAALAIGRAGKSGSLVAGTAAEIGYLQTGEGPLPVRAEPVLPSARFGLSYARRVGRTRSWTPLARLPRALLAPGAVAIAHNSLLRDMARHEQRGVGFHRAETILENARRRTTNAPEVSDAAQALARTIVGGASLEAPWHERALRLVEAVSLAHLAKAARDMSALRAVSLPAEVWTGSGGLYAPRAIGLEVLRRGGRVRRFDHGTPRGFVKAAETTALLETSVSSGFVLTTEAAATICRDDMAVHPIAGLAPVTLSGARGDPIFRRLPARRSRVRGAGKLRVVYAPTQFLGFRQLVPALPPDPLHLDWQLRLAGFLNALPGVDFICQAHPEGLFHHKPHPLESDVPTRRGNFQAQFDQADVFVFDYPSTTALWETACTDARIVFLDMGAGHMTPEIARLFAQRATVLPVTHGDNHRMDFDEAALRDAVLSETGPTDPTDFRRLLAGDA